MPQYTPPLRDMQFVMHELLNRHPLVCLALFGLTLRSP